MVVVVLLLLLLLPLLFGAGAALLVLVLFLVVLSALGSSTFVSAFVSFLLPKGHHLRHRPVLLSFSPP